jgi:hypothetical protein
MKLDGAADEALREAAGGMLGMKQDMREPYYQDMVTVRDRAHEKILAALEPGGELDLDSTNKQSFLVTIIRWLKNGSLNDEEVAAMLWDPIIKLAQDDLLSKA